MKPEPPTGALAARRGRRPVAPRDDGPDADRPRAGEIHSAHVCALYSGPEERDRLLVPLQKRGLRNRDHHLRLIADEEPGSMRQPAAGSPGPRPARGPGQPGPRATSRIAPRTGESSVEGVIASLVSTLASASDDGRSPQRAAAARVLDGPDAKGYESAVDHALAERPTLFLCMYDLQRLGVSTLLDVFRTHSEVLLDGTLIHNPHYLPPTDYPEPTPDAVARYPLAKLNSRGVEEIDQWLSLTGAEIRVTELVASGMTNRAVAEDLRVSRHTVDAHLKHIYLKLGIHSRVELTVLALQHGPAAV